MTETPLLQSPTPAPPVTCEAPPVEIVRANSLSDSDGAEKTIIALEDPHTVKAVPSTGAAILSTENGRRPTREPPGPPYPPVIVRSNKVIGVVQYANYWRNKYGKLYHSFFTNSGWIIADLWDNADIHLESPGFLEEVLLFITRDNEFRARKYAFEWSQAHRDKLDTIGGDMTQVYDHNNPMAIVDKVFTDGETRDYPHLFLWHVVRHMRQSMSITVEKQQAMKAAANAHGMVKTDSGTAGNMALGPPSTVNACAITTQTKQPQSVTSPDVKPRKTSHDDYDPQTLWLTEYTVPLQAAKSFEPSGYASIMSSSPRFNGPPPQGPSFGSSQLVRGYSSQSNGYPMGQHTAPTPLYPNGQLRNPRNRPARSSSNPYSVQPQPHGWADNVGIAHGQHMRQPSGPVPSGQAQQFFQPMLMGPGVVAPNHMPQFSHQGSMVSPQMHHVHLRHSPMLQQNIVPPQPVVYVPYPTDSAFHKSGLGGSDQYGIPFGEMTNNVHYPPPRGPDSRVPMPRRPSYSSKPSGLYNPYGTERPDKAGFAMIPLQSNVRKTHHNSFSNHQARNRKYSASFGSQPFEREGNTKPSGHYGDGTYIRYTYTHPNKAIVDDMEAGCSHDRIGPKNKTVTELHVGNLPVGIAKEELGNFFQQRGKVTPTEVILKSGSSVNHFTHAFVHFASVADARQGLLTNGKALRGHSLAVSVPNRHWKFADPMPLFEGRASNFHTQSGTRMSSYGSQSTIDHSTAPTLTVQYSPQDARSDLRRINQQQQDHLTVRGSPELRKAKKQMPSSQNVVFEHEDQSHNDEVEGSADKLDAVFEKPESVELIKTDPSPPDKHVDLEHSIEQPAVIGLIPTMVTSTQDVGTSPVAMVSAELEVVAEEPESEDFKAEKSQSTSLEDTQTKGVIILQLVPKDLHTPFHHPVAKVALPPVDKPLKADENASTSEGLFMGKEQAEDVQRQDTTATARVQEDTASDDDQKNDLSFHSAQESPGYDIEHNETKTETPPSIGTPSTSVTSETILADPRNGELKASVSLQAPLASDTTKKSGAKQTQSLFPWAKQSKSQAKKERQAKKKDKRREKEKGKTDKVVSPTTNCEATGVADSKIPEVGDLSQEVIQLELAPVGEAMITSGSSSPKKYVSGKRDGKDTVSSPVDATSDKVNNMHASKEAEGKHSQHPARVVQVTQKLEAQHSTVAQNATQIHPDEASLEASVLCPSKAVDTVSLPESEPVVVGLQQSDGKDEPVRKTKAALHKIAVPNLSLLKCRPSLISKASNLSTFSLSFGPVEASKEALEKDHAGNGM
jgi:hypothetical protein